MSKKATVVEASGCVGCIFMVIGLIIVMALGGVCVHYDISFWAPRFLGHPVNVPPMWVCMIIGIPLFEISIPIAALTFLCSFFM